MIFKYILYSSINSVPVLFFYCIKKRVNFVPFWKGFSYIDITYWSQSYTPTPTCGWNFLREEHCIQLVSAETSNISLSLLLMVDLLSNKRETVDSTGIVKNLFRLEFAVKLALYHWGWSLNQTHYHLPFWREVSRGNAFKIHGLLAMNFKCMAPQNTQIEYHIRTHT